MTVCHFEITDPHGKVKLTRQEGLMSVPADADPVQVARDILEAPDSAGWSCKVWITDGILGELGEPDAQVTA